MIAATPAFITLTYFNDMFQILALAAAQDRQQCTQCAEVNLAVKERAEAVLLSFTQRGQREAWTALIQDLVAARV